MKIRAKIGFAGSEFSFYGGETKIVSKELGELLIRDGLAEEVQEGPKTAEKAPKTTKKAK